MKSQLFHPNCHRYSPNPDINETIQWLSEQGIPPIPIAPWHSHTMGEYYNSAGMGEPPQDKFTGKNPSFMSRNGNPILVNHRIYQERLPNREELARWFQDRRTGVATMGGWQNVIWVDIDAKRFESPESCQIQVEEWLKQYGLGQTYIERTGRGGYHIALRWAGASSISLTRVEFADRPAEDEPTESVGELLGRGMPVVLAPTRGVSGRYRCLYRGAPLRVESLEAVGLRLLGAGGSTAGEQKSSKGLWFRTQIEQLNTLSCLGYTRRPLLQKLLRQSVLDLLGQCHLLEAGQRSDVLVAIAHEAIGWQNWLTTHGYPFPMPDAETFLYQVGERMGLDQDRVERILNSSSNGVPVVESLPGLHYHQGDRGCAARLRQVWRA